MKIQNGTGTMRLTRSKYFQKPVMAGSELLCRLEDVVQGMHLHNDEIQQPALFRVLEVLQEVLHENSTTLSTYKGDGA